MTGVRRRRSSQSEAVVYLENGGPGITKLYTSLHTGRVYNHTGYDITGCFQLAVMKVKKRSQMLPPTASGRISREWFKQGLQSVTSLSGTIGLTNLPDMTSLAVSSRLQNALYCLNVLKTGVAGIEVHNLVTV